MWRACHFLWHRLLDPLLAQISISERAILLCLTHAWLACQLGPQPHSTAWDLQTLPGSSWMWGAQLVLATQQSLEAACFWHSWLGNTGTLGIAFMLVVADPKPRTKPPHQESWGHYSNPQSHRLWKETSEPVTWTSSVSGWYYGIFCHQPLWTSLRAHPVLDTLSSALHILTHVPPRQLIRQVLLSPFYRCGRESAERVRT